MLDKIEIFLHLFYAKKYFEIYYRHYDKKKHVYNVCTDKIKRTGIEKYLIITNKKIDIIMNKNKGKILIDPQ